MKKAIILTVAMVLFAGSAFAAGVEKQPRRGVQKNVSNTTTATDTVVVNAGERNQTEIGVVRNKGGNQQNVTNRTTLDNTTVVNSGRGNKASIGTVSNE